MQREYRKKNYQDNPEIHKKHQKEVRGMSKNKYIISFSISFNKLNKDSIIFAKYVIEVFINAVSDYVSMKNITFSLHKCTIQ